MSVSAVRDAFLGSFCRMGRIIRRGRHNFSGRCEKIVHRHISDIECSSRRPCLDNSAPDCIEVNEQRIALWRRPAPSRNDSKGLGDIKDLVALDEPEALLIEAANLDETFLSLIIRAALVLKRGGVARCKSLQAGSTMTFVFTGVRL